MNLNIESITPEWLKKHFRTLMNLVRRKEEQRFGLEKQHSGWTICCNRCGEEHLISEMKFRFSVNHPIHGLLNLWYCDKCYKKIMK